MKIIGANITGSFILNNQDVTTAIQTSNVWSGSVATDISSLNAETASINTSIASLNTATASLNTSVNSLNNTTASLLSFTASQQALNATLATTGSNTFVGSQTVTGSLSVSSNITAVGTLTAQTLVVQTITSSVDFVTGSTRFGSVIGNSHQFTGSVSISGSTTVAGQYNGSGAGLTSIPNSALNNSTISGISLGSNLATLTIGSGLSGTSYNGSGAVTIACTITNNNQLTNGAGYITSAGNAATATLATTATTTTGNAGSVTYLPNRTDSAAYPILWGAAYSNTIGTIAYSCAAVTIQSSTGTVTATTFSGALTTAQNVVFSNVRKGLVGVYDPAQTQAVFAMGASYVLTDGGASSNIGPLYGLGWSYNPDYGGSGNNPQSKAGLNHQLLHMQNGVTTTAIGSGIWTSGNIQALGDVTAYYSDMRLKTKISNINNALDKVMKLNGFYYVNNDVAKEYGYTSDKVQIGVSAQEVESILPEIVSLAPFDATGADAENPLSKSGEHYKTVKYDKIVPLLIEAIKEQQSQIEELKTIINGLTK